MYQVKSLLPRKECPICVIVLAKAVSKVSSFCVRTLDAIVETMAKEKRRMERMSSDRFLFKD